MALKCYWRVTIEARCFSFKSFSGPAYGAHAGFYCEIPCRYIKWISSKKRGTTWVLDKDGPYTSHPHFFSFRLILFPIFCMCLLETVFKHERCFFGNFNCKLRQYWYLYSSVKYFHISLVSGCQPEILCYLLFTFYQLRQFSNKDALQILISFLSIIFPLRRWT